METAPIIEFEHAAFSYEKATSLALQDVNLSVQEGEFVCILGANGSGKSTLARHINALLLPFQGSVKVLGQDTLNCPNLFTLRSQVGMVFQNPENQAVASHVEDDVAFGPENLGLPPEEIRRRVDDALACVHMTDLARSEVHMLSGGQQQRVAIAGALAMEPRILVLDEPGAMLDVRGRRGIMRVLRELHAKGMTIVLITHFMEDALEADRVVVLDKGEVALEGAPDEVLTQRERLQNLNLAVPFALQLSAALQDQGFAVQPSLWEEEVSDQLCQLFSRE